MQSVLTIVSGAQTGADQAVLDAALAAKVPVRGYVPRGRRNEDGTIPGHYPNLVETVNAHSEERTVLNVATSDGLLVLTHGSILGGTLLAWETASILRKPRLHVDFSTVPLDIAETVVLHWLQHEGITSLNVAGPRASDDPAIYDKAHALVLATTAYSPPTSCVPVALFLAERAAANFRHWDQIRWLVPAWFLTLCGAAVAIMGMANLKASALFSLLLALFGVLCITLLRRLSKYHQMCASTLDIELKRIVSDDRIRQALSLRQLPFSFEGKHGRRTATFLLEISIFVFTVAAVVWFSGTVYRFWLT